MSISLDLRTNHVGIVHGWRTRDIFLPSTSPPSLGAEGLHHFIDKEPNFSVVIEELQSHLLIRKEVGAI